MFLRLSISGQQATGLPIGLTDGQLGMLMVDHDQFQVMLASALTGLTHEAALISAVYS
jgi:hypothetical protein